MEQKSKKILILSGVDFKEISIQVIRRTPEAFVAAGWEVHYLVGRDRSKHGDYFYEKVINPQGVNVHRFDLPLAWLHGLWNHSAWLAFAFRVRNLVLVFMLGFKAARLYRKHEFSVIYGNEIYGVIGARIARTISAASRAKFVIRFYGVHMISWYRKKQWFRFVTNIMAVVALRTRANLCIMTNDGTMGTFFLRKLRNKTEKILFFVNGVESKSIDPAELQKVKDEYFNSPVNFLSVCRLVPQKRVDRSVRLIAAIVNNGFRDFRYTAVGEGAEHDNLIQLATKLGVLSYINFVGPIPNKKVKYFLESADVFLTMDDVSNVGNPLLEAIRYNKFIVTIDTGETSEWIKHDQNGLIFPVSRPDLTDEDYDAMAKSVIKTLADSAHIKKLRNNLLQTEKDKLWTWDQRMAAEVKAVGELIA